MTVYRFTHKKFAGELSGTGARLVGGRWNPVGVSVVYTSESISLALLEVLANTYTLEELQLIQLMEIAIEKGRKTRPDIKLGICGEHGGEPESVKFCHKLGLNYVSCSPFRVPVARLAAAQAALD